MASPMRMALATATAGLLVSAPATAQRVDVNGEIAAETRLFPQAPLFPGQQGARISPSFVLVPELTYESASGMWRVTGVAFVRLDAHDSHRTHVDLRELGVLYLGNRVTAFAGVGKVFWGVTEVNHLVDVINQTDAVEDIDNEDKLGQPMVSVTFDGPWGSFDVFYLPMFRERTFPAGDARLRGPLPISSHAIYESSAGRWHQDFALRWSRPIGPLDVGASFFHGTSREPRFVVVARPDGAPELAPRYDLIDQFGVDAQWTGSHMLVKFEGITRGGYGTRFVAATGGIEYTLYQLFGGNSDLGLLGEIMLDGRPQDAPPTVFDHDVFGGIRWALNDVSGTSILAGPVLDFETGEVLALIEAERRIGSSWKLGLEARLFANTVPGDVTHGLRHDGFAAIRLSRFF
jgi:hypothetical protein